MKLGFAVIATTFWCSSVIAQSTAKYPGRKDPGSVTIQPEKSRIKNTTPATVVKSRVDPRLLKARGGVTVAPTGKTSRNCTSAPVVNPYSITRENFNRLPQGRQQFVLDNSHKYSIVD